MSMNNKEKERKIDWSSLSEIELKNGLISLLCDMLEFTSRKNRWLNIIRAFLFVVSVILIVALIVIVRGINM